MASASELSKWQRRRQAAKINAEKLWKQDVPCDSYRRVLEEWAHRLKANGWQPGKWRPVTVHREHALKDFKNKDKYPGALLRYETTWNLYFYKDRLAIDDFLALIETHPLKAVGEKEPDKDTGHWDGPNDPEASQLGK